MAKYVCVRKCFYDNRLFEEGEIVRFSIEPPNHFQLIEETKEAEPELSQKELEIEALRKEMTELKIPFDMRWNKVNLEHALIIGKKERGLE